MVMQMMVDCCAMDDTACLTLKEEFPELQSTDPDMNPDFCAMHGNVCTRWADCYYAFLNTCKAQHRSQPICLRGIASIHKWTMVLPCWQQRC